LGGRVDAHKRRESVYDRPLRCSSVGIMASRSRPS